MTGSSSPNPTLLYIALSWIVFPAAFLYTIVIAIKQKQKQYFLQRLGIYKSTSKTTQPIWCHCASVGEIKTALPLLNNLLAGGEHLVISTNTTTGLKILQQANLNNTSAVFLPLDYACLAKKFINVFSPKLCLVLETELWPNILLAAIKKKIPIVIINGRISNKTLNAPTFLKQNYMLILKNTLHIFASSKSNLERFIELGAHKSNISVLDNLKFSNIETIDQCNSLNPLKQKYVLCASTHADEELQILREWKSHTWNNIQLAIAIRHPQRKIEVCKVLKDLNLDYVLHSEGMASTDAIYIIDTIGELRPFIEHADLVFMGGSLVPNIGGHNVLEAAQFGKCILTGPHYENFAEIVEEMHQLNSIIIVKHAEDLVNQISLLIDNEERSKQLGNNAKNFVVEKSNVLNDYTDKIFNLIHSHSS